MFTKEELVKIHNAMIQFVPMAEAEVIVSKIRNFFKEEEMANANEIANENKTE